MRKSWKQESILFLALVFVAGWQCFAGEAGTNAVGKAEPTKANAGTNTLVSAPLLLDDKPLILEEVSTNLASAGQIADNSRCFVCHVNYSFEQLAVTHARTNIGCVKCHGASDAHIADESWASGGNGTAPDIIILKAKINLSCWECHEPKKLSHKDHLEFMWGVAVQQYCTDCHGKHRLPQRKCKWK